jgi:hypothetical protein
MGRAPSGSCALAALLPSGARRLLVVVVVLAEEAWFEGLCRHVATSKASQQR